MGNLDDYNRHKTLGPAAGQPTSIGGFMGQRDSMHAKDDMAPRLPPGFEPLGLHGWLEGLPSWFISQPIRRGLGVMIAGNLLAMAPLPVVLRAVAGLVATFGLIWLVVGLAAYLARRSRR